MAFKQKIIMTTLLLTIAVIFFYIIGGIFFSIATGVDIGKTKNVLILIFYPITMWFIK